MKLWKYILGAIAFIGGILAVKSSKDKKVLKVKLEDNKKQVKTVKTKAKKVEAKDETLEVVRARDENGHYIADDPSTPDVNEAWVVKTVKKGKK